MYLNLIQIAESFGVAEKVVEGWIREEGLPHTPDRGRLLFDRAQVVQWAANRGLASSTGFLAPETRSPFATGIRLEPLLRTGGIWRDVPAVEVPVVCGKIAAALPGVAKPVAKLLAQRLGAKGGVTVAPVGGGFALPHPSTRITLGRDAGTLGLLLLRDPLPEAGAPDGVPVTRLFFFIAPSPRAHLDLLGRLSRALSRGPLRERIVNGANDAEIFLSVAASDEVRTGAEANP